MSSSANPESDAVRAETLTSCNLHVQAALHYIGAEDELELVDLSGFHTEPVDVNVEVVYSAGVHSELISGQHAPSTGRVCANDDEAKGFLQDSEHQVLSDEQYRAVYQKRLYQWAFDGCQDSEQPQTVRPEFFAAVHYQCNQCNGHGRYSCANCHGHGTVEMNCSLCQGRGSIVNQQLRPSAPPNATYLERWMDVEERCNACSGTGRRLNTCGGCNGAGIVQCSKCAATGMLTKVFSYSVQANFHSRVECKPKKLEGWLQQTGVAGTLSESFSVDKPTITPGCHCDSVQVRCQVCYGDMVLQCTGGSEILEFYGRSPIYLGSSELISGLLNSLSERVRKSIDSQQLGADSELSQIPIISEAMAQGFSESHRGHVSTTISSPLVDYGVSSEIKNAVRAAAKSDAGKSLRLANAVAMTISLIISIAYIRYIFLQDSRDLRESFSHFAIVGMCVMAVTFLFCWSLRLWTRKRLVSRSRKMLRRESAHKLERSGMTHRTLLMRTLMTWAPSALVSGAAFFYALIVYTQIIKP